MINRRNFMTRMLSTTAIPGLSMASEWLSLLDASEPNEHLQPEHYQPFDPSRIVILRPPFSVAASRKKRVLDLCDDFFEKLRQKHPNLFPKPRSLNISDEKVDLLLTLCDVLANYYAEADFYDWAKGLLIRENRCSSLLDGNVGMFHRFQVPGQKITTRVDEADGWLFLCPDGVGFAELYQKSVYAILGFVMSDTDPGRELNSIVRLGDLIRRIHTREDQVQFWKRLAQQRPASVVRQLNHLMAECWQDASQIRSAQKGYQ